MFSLCFRVRHCHPAGFFYNLLLEEHLDELEDIYLGQKTLEEIKSGKMKTYSADEVYKELGL